MTTPLLMFDFAGTLVTMRPARLLTKRTNLVRLAQKYQLGIVTGARRPETQNILTQLSIASLFPQVITTDDSAFRKPDPRLLPSNTLAMIGDGYKDQLMAQKAKVKFFRVTPKTTLNQIIKTLLKSKP